MQLPPKWRACLIPLVVLVLLAPLGAPRCARASEDGSAARATGIALVRRKAYAVAAAVLRTVLESDPQDSKAAFYLGVALNRSTGGKEAESLLKRGLREDPENPEVNFELGLHYYNKDVPAEASDYFEQVIYLQPAGSRADLARAYLKRIEDAKKEKQWEINLTSGLQYDSNVILANGSFPLPAGYSGRGDWSGVVNLRGAYTPVKSGTAEVTAAYSFYQNLHTSLTDFDVTQNLVDLSASYALAPSLKLKGSYSLEYLMLGGAPYDWAHTVSPSLSRVSERWGTTTVDYHFSTRNYWNSEKFSTNTDQNGTEHLIGISHLLPVGNSGAFWVLYAHDISQTFNTSLGFQGDRVLAGYRRQLPFGVVADLSGDLNRRCYREADPSFGVRRQDTQYTVSLSLLKNISERYSLSLGEVFSRNLSNIADFTYTRALTSALVNARF